MRLLASAASSQPNACGHVKHRWAFLEAGAYTMNNNLQLAQEYIHAIEDGATGDALSRFFTPDVVVQEMPNRIAPRGSISDLTNALQGAERGRPIFTRQTYNITNLLADGNRVALEIDWLGVTAIQNLPAGSEMRDHVAIFLEFRDGRIARQRHYDCFEPKGARVAYSP